MNRVILIVCLAISVLAWADTPAAVIGAGHTLPTPVGVAPGQVITFFMHGIGTDLKSPVFASSLPLPTSLAGISATFLQASPIPVPILGLEPVSDLCALSGPGCASTYTAVTVQIPFNIVGQNPLAVVGNLPPPGRIDFSENGVVQASMVVVPWVDQIHTLRITGAPLNLPPGDDPTFGFPAVTHANGSRVSEGNPARSGEVVAIYAVGLGGPMFAKNGDAPAAPIPISGFRVSFDLRPNALASRPSKAGENGTGTVAPDFVGLVPGGVGLYQINVKVPALPAGIESCDPSPLGRRVASNLTINIFGPASVDGVGICVDPGS